MKNRICKISNLKHLLEAKFIENQNTRKSLYAQVLTAKQARQTDKANTAC